MTEKVKNLESEMLEWLKQRFGDSFPEETVAALSMVNAAYMTTVLGGDKEMLKFLTRRIGLAFNDAKKMVV